MAGERAVPTYLLTWNEKKWEWDDLSETVELVRTGVRAPDQWSCARTRKIREGDRLFIMKQGQEPRGIFGSCWATSDAFEDLHWREDTSSESMYVLLEWDALLDPTSEPILSREVLKRGTLGAMHWDTQQSGNRIPDKVANKLEGVWAAFLKSSGINASQDEVPSNSLPAGHGAGFGSADNNAVVELAAVKLVTSRYLRNGWTVESQEREKCGYDLLCRKARTVRNVEVKGVTGAEEAFIMTAGEVAQASQNPNFFACIVTEAVSDNAVIHEYEGMKLVKRFDFAPIQYRVFVRKQG